MAEGTENQQEAAEAARNLTNRTAGLAAAFGDTAAAFMTGTPNIDNALSMLGNRGFTGAIRSSIGYLEGQLEVFQNLSSSGITFGAELEQMTLAATSARMSQEEMVKLSTENAATFALMGMTANAGVSDFLKRQAEFFDDSAPDGLNIQLQRLGMTTNEINETFLTYDAMQTLRGRKEALTDAERNAKAAEFAEEMDKLAKLTGKQREALAAEQLEIQRQGDVIARSAQLGIEGQKSLTDSIQEARNIGGDEVGKLVNDILTKGTLGQDVAELGGMMSQTTDAAYALREAQANGTQAEIDRAEAALASAIAQEAHSEQMMGLTRAAGNANVGDAAVRVVSAAANPLAQSIRDFMDQGMSGIDAYNAAIAKAAAEQDETQDTPDDETDTTNLTQNLIGVRNELLETAEAVQRDATAQLFQGLTTATQSFKQEFENFDLSTEMTGILGDIRDFFTGAGTDRQQADRQAEADERAEDGDFSGAYDAESGIPRNTGSIGATGSILEDFGEGTRATLHGNEGVVTIQDLENMAKGVTVALASAGGSSGVPTEITQMANSITPALQGMVSNLTSSAASGGLPTDFMDQMKTVMSASAEQMTPMLEQVATQMQGPMQEMAEQMRGPMESMAGNMQRQIGIATRQLRSTDGIGGDVMRGLGL